MNAHTYALSSIGITEFIAEKLQKWVLHISCAGISDERYTTSEIMKCAPYLSQDDAMQMFMYGSMELVFDDEESAWEAFNMTVGDDGPTKTNQYNGPVNIFAYICGPNGGITENT